MIDPIKIIKKHYDENSEAYKILVTHCKKVAEKALKIAEKFPEVDKRFVYEAAMLHDIGIIKTNAPLLDCYGKNDYLMHTVKGQEILENENLPKHALVARNHIAISKEDIKRKNLPLPLGNYMPKTLEEEIIYYADKFYSKKSDKLNKEKDLKYIRRYIKKLGEEKLKYFNELHKKFS